VRGEARPVAGAQAAWLHAFGGKALAVCNDDVYLRPELTAAASEEYERGRFRVDEAA